MENENGAYVPYYDCETRIHKTIFVGCSWDWKTRCGTCSYAILGKDGSYEIHDSTKIKDTNTVRLLLLSVLSGLLRTDPKDNVRIVSNNNAVLYTLNRNNMGNEKNRDLKSRIADEVSKHKYVCTSVAISATDDSYLDEVIMSSKKLYGKLCH